MKRLKEVWDESLYDMTFEDELAAFDAPSMEYDAADDYEDEPVGFFNESDFEPGLSLPDGNYDGINMRDDFLLYDPAEDYSSYDADPLMSDDFALNEAIMLQRAKNPEPGIEVKTDVQGWTSGLLSILQSDDTAKVKVKEDLAIVSTDAAMQTGLNDAKGKIVPIPHPKAPTNKLPENPENLKDLLYYLQRKKQYNIPTGSFITKVEDNTMYASRDIRDKNRGSSTSSGTGNPNDIVKIKNKKTGKIMSIARNKVDGAIGGTYSGGPSNWEILEESFENIFSSALKEGGHRTSFPEDFKEKIAHKMWLIKDPAKRQEVWNTLWSDVLKIIQEKNAKDMKKTAQQAAVVDNKLNEHIYMSEDDMLDAIDSAYGKFDSVDALITKAGGNQPDSNEWVTGIDDVESLYYKVRDVVKKEATWSPVAYKSWAGCEYLRDTWNLQWDKAGKSLINIREASMPACMRPPKPSKSESMARKGAAEIGDGVYAYLRHAKRAASSLDESWFDLILEGPGGKRVIDNWASRSKHGSGYRGGGIGPMAGPAYQVYEIRSETGFSGDCQKTGVPSLRYMRHLESHIMDNFHDEYLDVYGGP